MRKLRRIDLETGMRIRHRWYQVGNEYEFTATCVGINRDENKAMMQLQGTGGKWAEEWNLAHTNNGLRQGEYREVHEDE